MVQSVKPYESDDEQESETDSALNDQTDCNETISYNQTNKSMAMSCRCKGWFHKGCLNISRKVFTSEKNHKVWQCKDCLNI